MILCTIAMFYNGPHKDWSRVPCDPAIFLYHPYLCLLGLDPFQDILV